MSNIHTVITPVERYKLHIAASTAAETAKAERLASTIDGIKAAKRAKHVGYGHIAARKAAEKTVKAAERKAAKTEERKRRKTALREAHEEALIKEAKLKASIFAGAAAMAEEGKEGAEQHAHVNNFTKQLPELLAASAGLPAEFFGAAIKAHNEAAKLVCEGCSQELRDAEQASYNKLVELVKEALRKAKEIAPEKGGYVLKDVKYDVYQVRGEKVTVAETHGDSFANRRNTTGKPVVAYVYGDTTVGFPSVVYPDADDPTRRFIVDGASSGALKGHLFDDGHKEGAALAFDEEFIKADANMGKRPYTISITDKAPRGWTGNNALTKEHELRLIWVEKIAEAAKAAQNLDDLVAELTPTDEAEKAAHKAAIDAATADANVANANAEEAKNSWVKSLEYFVCKANPDYPGWTAAKAAQRGSFATTPCDLLGNFVLSSKDIVTPQTRTIDEINGMKIPWKFDDGEEVEVLKVVEKKPDGTEAPAGYQFNGCDGYAVVPVERVFGSADENKEGIWIAQFRTSDYSSKGMLDIVELIGVSEAKTRWPDAKVNTVRVSEDGTHNVFIIADDGLLVKSLDQKPRKRVIPHTTAMFDESVVKSGALDNGDIKAWLRRNPSFGIMTCGHTMGEVYISRQLLQTLHITEAEVRQLAAKTTAKVALTANPFFAKKAVCGQIQPLNHQVLDFACYSPAGQRQLEKSNWNAVTHGKEGHVLVEGCQLALMPDPQFYLDMAAGLPREKAGLGLKPGCVRVPASTGYAVGQTVLFCRYPLTNPRPMLLTVAGYCPEGRMEVSMAVGSTFCQDGAADFDGDHGILIAEKCIVDAAIRTRRWIDSIAGFNHFTCADTAGTDTLKHLPQCKYSEAALSLGEVGAATAPCFVLQAMLGDKLADGRTPNADEKIIMPNGTMTTVKEIVELLYWICASITWVVDEPKKGGKSPFTETELSKRIHALTKGLYAHSQIYAKPYDHAKFGLLRGVDKLKDKTEVYNPYHSVSMLERELNMRLKTLFCSGEEYKQRGLKVTTDYLNYMSVRYGGYTKSGALTGGFTCRLGHFWALVWKQAREAGVDLNKRWAVPVFTVEPIYLSVPNPAKMYHIAKDVDISGKDFLELIYQGLDRELNWKPGWETIVTNNITRSVRANGLSISLFVARMERALNAASLKEDDDCGRRKTTSKETAYAAARQLIRAWWYAKSGKDLTDEEVDRKLYMELGLALIGAEVESTNMGASLQEWANYFSNEAKVKDSVDGHVYKRNFLREAADEWLLRHLAGIADDGTDNPEQAKKEMQVTDIKLLRWAHIYSNDQYLTRYRDKDWDHIRKNAAQESEDESGELDSIEDVESDDYGSDE